MPSVAELIRNKNAQFSEAFRSKDVAMITSMYTADARLMPPGADMLEGTSRVQGFWDGVLRGGITEARLETFDVDLVGGSTAVETGKFAMYAGRDVVDRGKYIVIWRNEDGVWKMHRDIWNSNVEKRVAAAR